MSRLVVFSAFLHFSLLGIFIFVEIIQRPEKIISPAAIEAEIINFESVAEPGVSNPPPSNEKEETVKEEMKEPELKSEEKPLPEHRKKRLKPKRPKKTGKGRQTKPKAALSSIMKTQAEKKRRLEIIARYTRLIKAKVSQSWNRPRIARKLSCKVRLKLLDNGMVIDAKIIANSGSTVFDNSVIEALYRADVLPLPRAKKYRALFTDGNLVVRFENHGAR